MKPKNVLKGTAFIPYSFQLEITKRTGINFEGEIVWTSINNAKTKVKGSLESDEIIFEEYESLSTDVEVPVNYIGKTTNNKVSGQFKSQTSLGSFEINLS